MPFYKKYSSEKVTVYYSSQEAYLSTVEKFGVLMLLRAKNKFEPLQKQAVKWILSEMNKSYNDNEYYSKLYNLKLLSVQDFFVVKKIKIIS